MFLKTDVYVVSLALQLSILKIRSINDNFIVHIVLRIRKITYKEFLNQKRVPKSNVYNDKFFLYYSVLISPNHSCFSDLGYSSFDFVYF